jgi:serine/threonine protein kinase
MAVTPQKIAHYQILEQLGKGGMGIVYKATDEKLERLVAIKVLAPETVGDEISRERFLREAQAAAKLNHPNITTIYAIDEVDNTIFIVMEYVSGTTLGEVMDSRRLTLAEILKLAIQIAEGLAEAHQKNVIHRDVKPDNLMLSPANQIKIMDFGLAKIRGQSRLTQDNFSMGTIDYISPELISRDREIDQRSDIFSFGVLLYEMLSGDLPFKGEHDWAILYAILNHDPLPLDARKLQIPATLVKLILKCLKKEPDFRYQSVAEIIVALKKIQAKLTAPEKSPRFLNLPVATRNQRIAVLTFSGILFVAAALGLYSKIVTSPNKHNSKAVEFILKGEISQARHCLQLALAQDSTFSSAWSNLGLVYLYQGEMDSCIYFSRRALLFDAQNTGAYFTLARAYEQKNQFDQAIQIYLSAIEQDSGAAPAYNEAAFLLLELGEIQRAIALLDKCLEQVPSSPYHAYTYKNLGKAYLLNENLEMALQYIHMALALDSTLTEAQVLLQEAKQFQEIKPPQSEVFTSK